MTSQLLATAHGIQVRCVTIDEFGVDLVGALSKFLNNGWAEKIQWDVIFPCPVGTKPSAMLIMLRRDKAAIDIGYKYGRLCLEFVPTVGHVHPTAEQLKQLFDELYALPDGIGRALDKLLIDRSLGLGITNHCAACQFRKINTRMPAPGPAPKKAKIAK